MALLEGEDLHKEFDGVVAVDGVSFGVERGEAVGLIGPNGAGKTTLFRILTGATDPDQGRVVFDGEAVTGLEPHEITHRGLVRTHQIARPFENMTLLENATVGAQFGGRNPEDPVERARAALEFVGLADAADQTPTQLSVGALKRLEIARVLATDPEILLLDEVAGGLDQEETEEIVDLIADIQEQGRTVFLIDHVMRALMTVSDRVLVLDRGQLIAEGTPEAIQNDERVVEAYLGEGRDDPLGGAAAGAD